MKRRQRKFFEQRRDEEQRHEERDGEVDDDDQREIDQVEPLLLGQQPDDAQRPDGGQQRSEDRDEDAPVAVVAVMVHHDDRRVDDDAQRHGDAGQRVDVDVQVQEVVEDRRHEDIDGQRRGDDGQVAQVAAHGEDEREQDGDAEQRAQVDLLQFARDVFRGVVGERGRQLGRETLLEARHLLLDRRGHPEHVRVRLAGDRQGDRVQSVDAEIARRPLLLPAGRGEVAQVVDAAVAFGDGNLPEVGCAPVAEAEDHGALRAVLVGSVLAAILEFPEILFQLPVVCLILKYVGNAGSYSTGYCCKCHEFTPTFLCHAKNPFLVMVMHKSSPMGHIMPYCYYCNTNGKKKKQQIVKKQ